MKTYNLQLRKKILCLATALLALTNSAYGATAMPLNAECGVAAGLVISQNTLAVTQSYSLCSTGTPANLNISSTNGPWTWQCVGNNGGQTQNCSTALSSAPACGSANNASLSSAPNAKLCSSGAATLVTGNGPWGWVCGQVFGASPVICSAQSTAATPAGRSWDFTNSLGINTHMGSTTTHYGNQTQTVADIQFLQAINGSSHIGFNHRRDTVQFYNLVQLLTQSNITSLLAPDQAGQLNPASSQSMFDQYASNIEGIEGANEPDHIITVNGLYASGFEYGAQTGIPAAITYQQVLYNLLKSDPLLSNIPVYNFALGFSNDANTTGNMSAYAEISNVHAYPAKGGSPYLSILSQSSLVVNMPGKPMVLSETGYPTIPPGGSINFNSPIAPTLINEVTEDVQAKYSLSTLFDAFNAGFKKTFLYELYDDGGPDPNSCDNANTSKEYHLGLFRCDLSPKPLAIALQNLVNILADTNANARTFTPQSLAFSLTQTSSDPNMNANAFNTLLQNAAGTYFLVLWAEPVLWNPTTAQETSVSTPNTVTVKLNAAKNFTVYDPMVGMTPINQTSGATQLSVQVYDHPIIIALN